MGLNVAQMTSPDEMRACFAMVTEENARILDLDGYGLRVGARASLVVLDAADPIEALRRRAARRFVLSRGRIVAEAPRGGSRLALPGRPATVSRRRGPGGVGEPGTL
jgi:cytosine deaminase